MTTRKSNSCAIVPPGCGCRRSLLLYAAAQMAICALLPGAASAQNEEEREPVRTQLEVKKLRVTERETPEYEDELSQGRGSEMDWLMILLEYDTAVSRGEYTDELRFSWSVGIIPKGERPIVMKREVSYIDVEAGSRHYAVMYVRPRFLVRYYGDERVRRNDIKVFLEVQDHNGEVIQRFHYPESSPKPVRKDVFWWQLPEPQIRRFDGELLTRLDTPFAPLEFNYYEYIKPERYD